MPQPFAAPLIDTPRTVPGVEFGFAGNLTRKW